MLVIIITVAGDQGQTCYLPLSLILLLCSHGISLSALKSLGDGGLLLSLQTPPRLGTGPGLPR